MFFEITGNRIFAYQPCKLFLQLGKNFFPNRENSSAQSAVEPLRATAGMPGDAPMARLYDLMRAREHYIILGIDETGGKRRHFMAQSGRGTFRGT